MSVTRIGPKRYACQNPTCGFISKRTRSVKTNLLGMKATFAVCFRCMGKVKEREEWLEWHKEMAERARARMMAAYSKRSETV